MRDPAERDDCAKIRQSPDRCHEEGTAAVDFRRHRLVLRWHTAHRIGNRAGDEPQAVIALRAINAGGKAVFNQGLIKQIAGEIAGKRPPRAVGAAQSRRETDHKETCVKRSENRNRRIVPVWLRRP